LFEFGHSSANARDAAAAAADAVYGLGCAATDIECSYDMTFMVVLVALYPHCRLFLDRDRKRAGNDSV